MVEFYLITARVFIGVMQTGQQDKARFFVGILGWIIGVLIGQVPVSQIPITKSS
jgi:hypothetical protein